MPSSRRRHRRPDARPSELLVAALQVFAARGYRQATLDDVAAAAGATKGAIYHYFASKEALLLRVLTQFQEAAFGRAEAALRDTPPSATAQLRILLHRVFLHRDRPTGNRLLLLLVRDVAVEAPTVYDRWLRQGPVRLWKLVDALIARGQASGEFRQDVDARVAVRLLIAGLLQQFIWQERARTVPAVKFDDARLIESAVDNLITLLQPPRPNRGSTGDYAHD